MHRSLAALLLTTSLLSCAAQSAQGQLAPSPSVPGQPPTLSTSRLVFSGVKTTTAPAQTAVLQNTSGGPLRVGALTLDGPDAAAFVLSSSPALPLTLETGQTLSLAFTFSPQGKVGVLRARLSVTFAGTGALSPLILPLSGLSTEYEQGEGEPPLARVVQALGYSTDVGGSQLLLGTSAPLLGQELAAPLFRKVGSGPVSLRPVARYSPDDLLSFGFFTFRGGEAVLSPVGVIARHQEQTLNPALDSGATTFDPASEPFGIYTGPSAYSPTNDYSLDRLNTGPTRHAMRVYPLFSEDGQPLPGYLLANEASSNGDYQDAVFVLTGAEALPSSP
ncbi:hypothetical protein [Deinococcus sp.]|uniref:hypothetical protein n=1 Tax=Deinococcus sp. TaxID=47478 RepID=UPI003C7D9821